MNILAKLFSKRPNKGVLCGLCNYHCVIALNAKGKCGVRVNIDGSLYTLVGDKVAAANLDPIEKKPLYHFLPGTKTFSFGTMGCNFECEFCQNWEIARYPAEFNNILGQMSSPTILAAAAKANGAASMSFTYNEPTVFFELMCSAAQAVDDMPCVIVSNGFMSAEAIEALPPNIIAANIDLKAFSDDFYKKYCKARLNPVLDNLKMLVKLGKWLEITTLLIPGVNDDPGELKDLATFIYKELGPDVPWHISRFHGAYKMANHPPTPPESMYKAFEIGRDARLNYVYLGNLDQQSATFCPSCQKPFIERRGFSSKCLAPGNECPACGTKIAGVWNIAK